MIEQFFTDYEKTAWAFFSFASFCFICLRMYTWWSDRIKAQAKSDQRDDWQAEFFDINIIRHKEHEDELKDLHKRLSDLEAIFNSKVVINRVKSKS